MKKIYLFITALFLWPVLTQAQNADSCVTALLAVDGTNTVEDLTGNGGSDDGAAAWFMYTPAEGGTINIETCNQGVDTEFEVFDGDCATLNQIATGSDNCATGNGNNYAAAVYDVAVTGGTTYYFEFHDQYSSSGFDFEFSFVATPTCSDVSGLATSAISETEVTFNWNPDGNTSWDYAVDVTGFDIGTATLETAADTFATVMSLTSDTYYDIYVRTNCGSETGAWEMITFKTIGEGDNCDVPIVIDLESGVVYADSNQTNCGRGDTYNETCLGSYDGGEDIVYELNLSVNMNIELILDPDGTTWYGVGIFDGCPDADNCVETATQTGSSISTINTQLLAGTYYIMASTWPSPDCIPNFHLTINGTEISCAAVTGLAAVDVSCTGGTAVWNSDGNTSWNYYYGAEPFDIDTVTFTTITDTFFVATDGVPGVDYSFYIQTDCGIDVSEWSSFTGQLPPCNDLVCDADEIIVDGDAVTVDNTWASYSDTSGSCWGGTTGNGDVWLMFDFTPTDLLNGIEIVTDTGSTNDSRIALWMVDNCPDGPVSFTELACSEDISTANWMSYIPGTELEGGTYYIQCGSWNGSEGSYDVSVNAVYVSDTCGIFLGGPWVDFNTTFGGAPVDSAGICPFNELTAFEVYASESYTVDNFSNGETYTFSMCNGSYGAWDAELSIWDEDGNMVAFASDTCSITWTATYDGTYVIGINEVGACGSESTNTSTNNGYPALTCEGSVSVDEIPALNFTVYPNPNNGQFSIVNEGVAGKYILEIMDITGKIVHSEQIQMNGNDRTEINSNSLNTGVYLVKMTNTEENYYRTIRMVIK